MDKKKICVYIYIKTMSIHMYHQQIQPTLHGSVYIKVSSHGWAFVATPNCLRPHGNRHRPWRAPPWPGMTGALQKIAEMTRRYDVSAIFGMTGCLGGMTGCVTGCLGIKEIPLI